MANGTGVGALTATSRLKETARPGPALVSEAALTSGVVKREGRVLDCDRVGLLVSPDFKMDRIRRRLSLCSF